MTAARPRRRGSRTPLAALALLTACGSTTHSTTQPSTRNAPVPITTNATAGISFVARVNHRSIGIYASAAALRPARVIDNPNRYGFPRIFLVKRVGPERLQVYLPMRPNGSTGWVRRRDVAVLADVYRLRINLRRHRYSLLRRGAVIDRGRIGVGRAVTPTPSGVYFVTELFRLTRPDGVYGPYGLGLSAYSNVLHEFAGADGQIGIHGTNDPAGIGTDVSHGCIRLANAGITRLARVMPLGTPVQIQR